MDSSAQDEAFKNHLEKILVVIGEREIGAPVQVHFKTELTCGGYLGIVNGVDLKGKNGELNLIIKSANTNEEVRKNIPLGECVDVELQFYDVLIPRLAKFCAEKGVNDALSGVPKTYWVEKFHGHEVIIMENLKAQGYDILNKENTMDDTQAALMMRVFAKFHALSFAFKNEHPEEFDALVRPLEDTLISWMVKGKMLETCIRSLRSVEAKVDPKIAKKLSKFTDGISDYIFQTDIKSDEYAVITHGDCWTNNMMFKMKEGTDIVEEAKLIDFQIARLSSFACDVIHFLHTCCHHTIWRNLDHYLKIYHTALSNQLHTLKSSKVITFEEVQQQVRKHTAFGLIMPSFFIKIMLAKSHEVASLEDTINGRFLEPFKSIENEHLYAERMKILIEYYYENDWL